MFIQKDGQSQLNRNVFLVRRESSWVDASFMDSILELLGRLVRPIWNLSGRPDDGRITRSIEAEGDPGSRPVGRLSRDRAREMIVADPAS